MENPTPKKRITLQVDDDLWRSLQERVHKMLMSGKTIDGKRPSLNALCEFVLRNEMGHK